jgi:hypothetical protein
LSTRRRLHLPRGGLVVGAALAATLGTAAPAAAQIVIAASNTPFNDISATGTSVGTPTDDSEHVITGASLTAAGWAGNGLLAGNVSVRVGNNGGIIWGNSATDAFTNATEVGYLNASPSGTAPNPFLSMAASNLTTTGNGGSGPRQFLAVHWDDMYPNSVNSPSIRWQVVNGNLIIRWTNENHFNFQSGGSITLQMVAYGNRTIAGGQPLVEFVYRKTFFQASQYQNDGGSATIGYRNWGLVANANDVEFGQGGGNNTITDPAFGDASMRPKVSGWVESANASLPHSVVIRGATQPCPVDVDGNGQVEPADISLFVNRWLNDLANGTLIADFDGNGSVEPADISLFVSTWFNALAAGQCP